MTATDDPNTIRVLHVDDDPAILDASAAFLEQTVSELMVRTETSPETARERVNEESFDCIVSDFDMPEMDGLEFFEAVQEINARLPFILFTGKGSEEIASRAINAGVTGYFQKGGPDQQRRLANCVRQAVDEYRTREVADRYSTVLDALKYPIYVVDETGHFEFVNEPFADLTGYDVDTIVGNTPDLIKTDEGVAQAESNLGSILSAEGPDTERFEIDIVPADGDPIPCRDHMAALPYEGEQFRGSVGILRNISEERRREQEIEYRTRAMDEAPVGITMSDPSQPDNPMVYLNDQFEELTGYDGEYSLGRNCRFLQGPDTDPERVSELREAIDAGESASVVLRNYTKDDELFWNRISVRPIRDDDGAIRRWLGFQEDITERVEYRQQLERQNERLDEFAGIVSHDLRNPVQVAKSRMALAQDEHDSEHLDAIADALDQMDRLIEDVLQFARQGQNLVETQVVDLSVAVDEAWTLATDDRDAPTLVVENGIETEGTTDAEGWADSLGSIRANEERLGQLLQNLFRNSVEHGSTSNRPEADDREGQSPSGSRAKPDDVTVTVGRLPDGFYVEDDGPGIPEHERDDVFETGYTTGEGGTGFGLSIVEQVAEAHGWDVRVTESADGGVSEERHGSEARSSSGARFEITGVEFID